MNCCEATEGGEAGTPLRGCDGKVSICGAGGVEGVSVGLCGGMYGEYLCPRCVLVRKWWGLQLDHNCQQCEGRRADTARKMQKSS